MEERAAAFVAQRGGCRATFFNYRRLLGGDGTLKKPLSERVEKRALSTSTTQGLGEWYPGLMR